MVFFTQWNLQKTQGMKNLRKAMDQLYAWGRNITGADAEGKRSLTQANLKDTWQATNSDTFHGTNLGGGFKYFFSPLFGEDSHFD